MTKMIGKPYAGKPHVRFDEGERRPCLGSPLSTLPGKFGCSQLLKVEEYFKIVFWDYPDLFA